MRVTPRKHGRHLSICPEDTGPDANYFIRLFCCLSEDPYQWTRNFLTISNKFFMSVPLLWRCTRCLFKVRFSLSLQATKALMWHLSSPDIITQSVSIFRPLCFLPLETSGLNTIYLNQAASVSIWPVHPFNIKKPAAPSSDIKTCTPTHARTRTHPHPRQRGSASCSHTSRHNAI